MNTEAKQDYEIANDKAKTLFDTLGLTVEASSPRGVVRDNEWPCIEYTFTFSKGGRSFVAEYRLGVGHVKPVTVHSWILKVTSDEESLLHTWASNPHAQFKDKVRWASVAAKLAKYQKVQPKAHEVLACLCEEGLSAHASSFENWASEFGYDADSRKAEQMYRQCNETYFKVETLISDKVIRQLAELHAQF